MDSLRKSRITHGQSRYTTCTITSAGFTKRCGLRQRWQRERATTFGTSRKSRSFSNQNESLGVPRAHESREVWNCKRDEGRSLGAGDQEQAPNHCELLALRALVVSVAGKGGRQILSGE